MTRLLEAFNRWFSSRDGVWHTFAATAAVVIFEMIFPHADPNHFWILYVLTLYSGVTQNILSYGNGKTSKGTEAILDRLEQLESVDNALIRRIAEKVGAE